MKLPPTFTKNEKYIHAVIETPKGSAAKYDYDEEFERNDPLIATANASDKYNKIKDLESMDPYLVEEIENFFNTYNNLQKKEVKVISKKGPDVAKDLIKKQLVNGNSL